MYNDHIEDLEDFVLYDRITHHQKNYDRPKNGGLCVAHFWQWQDFNELQAPPASGASGEIARAPPRTQKPSNTS
ncbi:hypothetical protein [Helicobacter baculiformis]